MLRRWITGSILPEDTDLALLVLRCWFGFSILLKHGFEKIFGFHAMSMNFPDPIHIGVVPSLIVALISDAVCSVLIMVGFATRWAALFVMANVAVAWALVHHFKYAGRAGDHGETIVLYFGGLLALAIAGPGRWSLDALFARKP